MSVDTRTRTTSPDRSDALPVMADGVDGTRRIFMSSISIIIDRPAVSARNSSITASSIVSHSVITINGDSDLWRCL